MLDLLKSILLGIVEGITEFLPVSSTGHLIIAQKLIHFEDFSPGFVEMYTYVIQLGAILAVMVLYRKKIFHTIIQLFPNKKRDFSETGLRFWLVIALACVPGTIAELAFGDLVEAKLFNAISVAAVLILGGFFMIAAEKQMRKKQIHRKPAGDIYYVTAKQAIIVGLFQCLAIVPGMSRSASTIIGGWFGGMSSAMAAEFSFFLAIPVMIGMSGLKIIKFGGFSLLTTMEMAVLLVGFLVSFIVALVVIQKFITYLQKHPMKPFALYRIAFGGLLLITALFGVIQF